MPATNMPKVQPDAVLGAIVGPEPLHRTEITKRLWDYVKERGLQDTVNRRQINADGVLRPFFGGASSATMFELAKYVSAHVTKVEAVTA